MIPSTIEILFDAIGLDLVRLTFLSIFLSTMSLTMHPALLIKTDPRKNNIKYKIKLSNEKFNVEAKANPYAQGQKRSIIPIGLFNRVNSINILR
tara:strand:+ start:508 stop:789 length:282 start_codon:yes stop_codon:yes gene_type:complete